MKKKILNLFRLIFTKKKEAVRDQVDWSQYDIPTFIRRGIPSPWDVKGGAK